MPQKQIMYTDIYMVPSPPAVLDVLIMLGINSFEREEVKKYMTDQERWFRQFGSDPIWTHDREIKKNAKKNAKKND